MEVPGREAGPAGDILHRPRSEPLEPALSEATDSAPPSRQPPARLVSVDALRGATILGMILVNNPGSWSTVYPPLLHAEWHGWTPTDLIFPFFLFLVGVSIALALGRRLETGLPPRRLLPKIARRSLLLFALGLLLSGYPFGLFGPRSFERLLETWRIPGVLQRIALCYLAASLLFLYCRRRTLVLTAWALLLGYWGLMTLVPVPGLGAPDLDSRGGHLAGWLDRTIFGPHVWSYAEVYDPEGLLSTLPAVATTLLGLLAGLFLLHREPGRPAETGTSAETVARLMVWGVAMVVGGHVWSWFFPVNKALWTSSYALLTAGQATCALALAIWCFDLRPGPLAARLARPLTLYGRQAITVFVGSGLATRTLAYVEVGGTSLKSHAYGLLFASWLPPYPASLAYALAWVLGWALALAALERRGWAWKV